MRIRALIIAASIVAPTVLSAQVRLPRRPPIGTAGTAGHPGPEPLPPTAGPVAQQLYYVHSRWSVDAYPLVTAYRVPLPGGGVSNFSTLGGGTHGDYRYGDHWFGTVDFTGSSMSNTGANSMTVEIGTRYRPLDYSHEFRPLFDLRTGYMRLFDAFTTPGQFIAGQSGEPTVEATRYSRGVGAAAGTGFEYTLTHTVSLTSEVTVMRTRMEAYDIQGITAFPSGNNYWMTSTRFSIGLKYNGVHTSALRDASDK
jgi:hypothetical protein